MPNRALNLYSLALISLFKDVIINHLFISITYIMVQTIFSFFFILFHIFCMLFLFVIPFWNIFKSFFFNYIFFIHFCSFVSNNIIINITICTFTPFNFSNSFNLGRKFFQLFNITWHLFITIWSNCCWFFNWFMNVVNLFPNVVFSVTNTMLVLFSNFLFFYFW